LVDNDDDSQIPGDLRSAIFAAAVKAGGEKEYEKVLSIYRKPPTPQHKQSCIRALTRGSSEELQQRTLAMILTDEVKTQDIVWFRLSARFNDY